VQLGRYIEYCKSTLKGAHNLKDKTILVDAANGANYKITPMLLEELGAKVIRVNCDPDGFNINEKSAVLDQSLFKDYAKKYEFDFCVAVDGDGDRLVLSDSKGDVCTGDEIIYTLALRNKKQNKTGSGCVVGTDMTNQGVVDALSDLEVDFQRAQVGDKFISRELVDKKLNLGGETSGHIIQREFSESGDANIALIQTLAALEELNLSLADIKTKINYKPQILESFDVKDMQIIETKEFSEQIKSLEKDHSNARISVRKSGTEPKIRVMVESDSKDDIASVMNSVKSLII
jgi:Phosphomannomutase